jgi:hypothetical protein
LASCSHAVAGPGSLDVRAVEYLELRVEADLVAAGLENASAAESGALSRLRELFHPLRGGTGGTGWEFGRAVCRSEILAALEAIPSVERVLKLGVFLAGSPVSESAPLPEGCLPFSGAHSIGIALPPEEVPGEGAFLAAQCPPPGGCEGAS